MTIARLGSVCFSAFVLGTMVSISLAEFARSAAGSSGYAAMLVDPRYRIALTIITFDLVLKVIGFGAVATLLVSRSRLGAWLAFAGFLFANLLGVVSDATELLSSFQSTSLSYLSLLYPLLDLTGLPFQLASYAIFGVLLLKFTPRAYIFGVICFLGVLEILFVLYCMDTVNDGLKAFLFSMEGVYNIAFCLVGVFWLNTQKEELTEDIEMDRA